MSKDDVAYAKQRLAKILSSSANSADVAAIVEAVERLIEAKVKEAIDNHVESDTDNNGGRF